jgi:hypothetical protein
MINSGTKKVTEYEEAYEIARQIAEKLHNASAKSGRPIDVLVAATVNIFYNTADNTIK